MYRFVCAQLHCMKLFLAVHPLNGDALVASPPQDPEQPFISATGGRSLLVPLDAVSNILPTLCHLEVLKQTPDG